MEAEKLVFNHCSEREEIEEIGEMFPDICTTVLAETFIIEAVGLGDLTGLVVATEDGDTGGVADF